MPVHPQLVEILPSASRFNDMISPANSNTKIWTLSYITDSVVSFGDWYKIELANILTPSNTTVGFESVIYFNLTDASNVNTQGCIKYECMFDSALVGQTDPDHSDASAVVSCLHVAGYNGGVNLSFNNVLDGSNPKYRGQIFAKNTVVNIGKSA